MLSFPSAANRIRRREREREVVVASLHVISQHMPGGADESRFMGRDMNPIFNVYDGEILSIQTLSSVR
jgi:hypothetical protein